MNDRIYEMNDQIYGVKEKTATGARPLLFLKDSKCSFICLVLYTWTSTIVDRARQTTAFDISDVVHWGGITWQDHQHVGQARAYGHRLPTHLQPTTRPLKFCRLLRFRYAHWYYGRLPMKLFYSFMPSSWRSPLHRGSSKTHIWGLNS